jgi:hypothetical protein
MPVKYSTFRQITQAPASSTGKFLPPKRQILAVENSSIAARSTFSSRRQSPAVPTPSLKTRMFPS